ncbi:peptidylprolyl isomerase [Thalassotalea atypica]|uniref:peptidylprolyl isomerase n=1 Tax=Thalassotalea atypica TaxID=2054316 RepID=UPI0025730939|nr:peptidylprolyl isomerase [Thalassotalea atypica]
MKKLLSVISISVSLLACQPLSADESNQWRVLDNNNLALMTLPHGQVVIELAPQFSPNHVTQFKQLVKRGVYNGNKFYRVIDGFVAQTGPAEGSPQAQNIASLALEGEWSIKDDWQMTLVQEGDLFAEQTGFKEGFAIAANPSEKAAWLAHCPGAVAMARSNEADSGNSHFYINNGQAPRYLDRIMSVFGRVVYGMNHVQAIQRTQVDEGDKPVNSSDYTPIVTMQMMSDLPAEKQWQLEVENTESDLFAERLVKRKERAHAFFFKKPPPVLDVCQVPLRTRIKKKV